MRNLDPVTNHLLEDDWRKSHRSGGAEKKKVVKVPAVVMEHVKAHCDENEIPQGRFVEEVLRWYLMTQVYDG